MNNETKHTAGEWTSIDNHDDTRTHDIQADGKNIATVWAYSKGKQAIDFKEQAANARLIAAAPELLFYLTKLLEADKNGNFDEFDKHIDGAYQATRKAIHG